MTRRERLENRIEKRETWAAAQDRKAAAGFDAAHRIADMIPMGQPILIGHHSERRARRARERIDSGMRSGCEAQDMASHHRAKADGLEMQLKRTIFSDDADAVEQIKARIAKHEAKSAEMVRFNKAWRKSKGDAATFAGLVGISIEQAERVSVAIAKAYSWDKQPYAKYELSNLRSRITADKKRLEDVTRQQKSAAEAEDAGGFIIKEHEGGYHQITFSEKPEYSIITDLKAAGFHWSGGSWWGTGVVPASVPNVPMPGTVPSKRMDFDAAYDEARALWEF